MNEDSSTKGYHYESHSTEYQDEQGNIYYTSSVKIRELDEGEVGILLAGNNSIFDPTLTPKMLAVPSEYDISDIDNNEENEEEEEDDNDEDEDDSSIEEKWFPSLLRHSWIYGLEGDDESDKWIEKIKDIIYSSEIIEKDNNNNSDDEYHHKEHHKRKRSKKSKNHHYDNDDFTYSTITTTLVPVDITYILLND